MDLRSSEPGPIQASSTGAGSALALGVAKALSSPSAGTGPTHISQMEEKVLPSSTKRSCQAAEWLLRWWHGEGSGREGEGQDWAGERRGRLLQAGGGTGGRGYCSCRIGLKMAPYHKGAHRCKRITTTRKRHCAGVRRDSYSPPTKYKRSNSYT